MNTPLKSKAAHSLKTATLIALSSVFLLGCGNAQESARKELAKQGKDFSPSSFIESVGSGEKQVVRLFIEAGIDVNATGEQGATALAIAAMKGDPEMIKSLLDRGANPNVSMSSGNGKGITPLMAAAAGGHLETVRLLLDKRAKVNATDDHGLAALDYARGQTNLAVLDVLWDHGAPFVTDAALAKLLDQFRVDLHAKAARSMMAGESPDGCRKFIDEQLLNFDKVQRLNSNQLVQARVRAFRTVSEVVEKAAMEEGINANGAAGASEKNQQTIKALAGLLRELQSNPAIQAGALLMSAEMNEPGIVKWLLDQHADLNARDGQGFTPLMWAALKADRTTVQILLDAGADVNAKDQDGWTAIMWAASQGRNDALKMVLSKKPDLNAANKDGKTALMIAVMMKQTAAVVLLKNAGAKE